MPPRKLTAELLAFAYELLQGGSTIKAIARGLGIHAFYLGAMIRKAERFGIDAALDHRRNRG